MAFSNFFQEMEEGEGGYLNIDRNREEALIAGLDRNRISKGVENARVLCVRNGGHTGLFVRIELKI